MLLSYKLVSMLSVPENRGSFNVQKDIILRAIEFVEANLEESISIKDITEQFENSHWYFQRLFRSVTGISLGSYLRLRRLSEAAVFLKTSQLRVIDIAIQFDFASQEAFARAFKDFSQLTPIEYRKSDKYVIRDVLNRITKEKIDFFWNNVQREPKIENLSTRTLYGSMVDFKSHFEEGSDCSTKVVDHWVTFLKSKKQISGIVDKKIYGVALSDEKELREKRLTYIACVETTDTTQSVNGFEYVQLPGGTYAGFENRGLASERFKLMDFIYGIWLPSSGYTRGLGYDYEVFDHRYALNDKNSISFFYIPITEGKSK